MNKNIGIVAVVALLVAVGITIFLQNSSKSSSLTTEKNIQSEAAMNKESTMLKDDAMMKSEQYIAYSKSAFESMSGKKRVLFFKASWCPTCNAANKDFEANLSKLPKDVVIFKADYDTESTLKSQYGITSQHTFVYVDGMGKEIKKWNGGATAEVITNTL